MPSTKKQVNRCIVDKLRNNNPKGYIKIESARKYMTIKVEDRHPILVAKVVNF